MVHKVLSTIALLAATVGICVFVVPVYSKGEKESQIIGVVGESAELPCDVDVSTCGKVYFITWTKNVSGEWKRLYLFSDAVEKPLQELANPNRADFFLEESSAFLRISPLRIEDDGTYKCDVTYVQGKCPSLSFATLITHAEPSVPAIEKDGKTTHNGSVVGPFYEGTSLTLQCGTSGGKPTPEVTWLKAGQGIDSESHVTIEKNGASTVISTVRVQLERPDLGQRIECHVQNEATDHPLVSWVEIDLHVPPSSLEVTGPTDPVTAGQLATFTCVIEGAKPAANALWYNRSEVLQVTALTDSELLADGTYRTTSTVEVPVTRHDHLATYYCKGTNSVLQNKGEAPLLKSLDVQVLYPPAVIVQPIGGVIVNESDSATAYCTYEANPFNTTDIQWWHEDVLLQVPTEGKYESSFQGYPTLNIRNVQKEDRGMYSCSLRNAVGRGNSTNEVEVNVLYPPTVKATISPDEVKEGDSISLFCDSIDGNPQNLLRVRWFKDDELLHETTEREIVWVGITRNTTGNYSCEGENAAGWGQPSEEQELIVRYLPGAATLTLLNPPPLKDEESFLRCEVEEAGLPQASVYRWERDGELLATTTSENYTTDPHRVTTRGNYSCSAVNEVGIGPRAYYHLAVKAPPSFIQDLPDMQGAARDAPFINFLCRVECDPLCEVHWKKDDVPLEDTGLYIIRNRRVPEDGPNNRFLSVSSTLQFNMTAWPGRRLQRERDRANYTCYSTANSAGPGVSSTMIFQVEYPPESLSLSDSQVDVLEGHIPESVECFASSWPPSTFLWKKGDKVIAKDDVLTFNETVTREHDGQYVCVVENRHGKAKIEMKLNVLYRPECSIAQRSDENGDTILVCTADGNPSFINFTWIKDNETLDDDYEINEEGTQSTFVLHDSTERYGVYMCIAINDVGESKPCEKLVDGPGLAGWHADFGDKSILVIAAVIGGIAILFVLVVIVIIIVMRKRRLRNAASPGKVALGSGVDNLYQNVSGPPDRKENGPPVSETEGNVMYENMPFHRQGPRIRQSLPADFSPAYQNLPFCRQEWCPGGRGNGHLIGHGAPIGSAPWNERKRIPRQDSSPASSVKRDPCPQHGHIDVDPPRRWGRASQWENGGATQRSPAAVVYADLALPASQRTPAKRASGTEYASLKFSKNSEHALQTGQQ